MAPFIRFLRARLDDLKPHLRERVGLRVALHKHPGVAGVMEAATDILQAVPGVTLVDLDQPAVGLQSVNLAVLPDYRRKLELSELEAARDAGVEALVAVIIPIIAPYARMSAIGRSVSSTFSKLLARASAF